MTQNLQHFWLPFSANKQYREKPRMLVSAKGMYYKDSDGRDILDSTSGLWCCNAGHCPDPIVAAIAEQAGTLDFCPTFHYGHPKPFELATKMAEDIFPDGINTVFFTNSGSEAADSALKIALAYQHLRGKTGKNRLIGRQSGYHGVNFGGTSLGGLAGNKLWYGGNLLPNVSHLPHTLDLKRSAFCRGQPEEGVEFADALLQHIQQYDARSIAAVIVEPVSGSAGVLIPPKGYLQRLREICTEHDILLIFDEVITAFGRLGTATAAEYFGVTPDMITFAKGVTSGMIPLGGVAIRDEICNEFFDNAGEKAIDLFHGYTYSGHPVACAAGVATLKFYDEGDVFQHARGLHQFFEDELHQLADLPGVISVRNLGLMGAVQLEPAAGKPGARGFNIKLRAFHDKQMMTRCTGDTMAFSPPLVASKDDIKRMIGTIAELIPESANA